MTMVSELKQELHKLGSPEKAAASAGFFKTGPGQYGEGDVFIGVSLPEQRRVAKRYLQMLIDQVEDLLMSPVHEFRMTALIIWVEQFKRGYEAQQRGIYQFYLAHTNWVNNWDLVDVSAEHIVGGWIQDRDTGVLDRLAVSELIWERRIAIVATYHFIKQGMPGETLRVADILLMDSQDLIQKAGVQIQNHAAYHAQVCDREVPGGAA
jgi:3-methyladenine DNA glycosylase AlkD